MSLTINNNEKSSPPSSSSGLKHNNDNSFPIQSLMDLYNRNGELLESEKILILNILILLLIFSIGCFFGSILFAPLFGMMKSNNHPLSHTTSTGTINTGGTGGTGGTTGTGTNTVSTDHQIMNYGHVSQKLFENMRLWNSKLNLDHYLFSGTSPDRDEEQLVHLERNIEKLEGEDRGDRTRVPEFREKLPKSTIFFKYFISNGRPVKFSGSKVLPKSEWKCFKSGWHYSFIDNLKKQEFFIVTQKSLIHNNNNNPNQLKHGQQLSHHGQDNRRNIFPLLGQMHDEFPFRNHLETDVSEQSQIRDDILSNINKIKNEKYENNNNLNNDEEINQQTAEELFEHIASNQAIIDDLVTGSGFQVDNALQNPKLSFIWKKAPWAEQMKNYNNYEKLRRNHKPGGFMIPYQKIYITSYNENTKFNKWLSRSLPISPSFVKDALHMRSISMRLSYSDDILLNNFVLPIYQTNKENLYIQIKGKTKFILFDPLHSDSMKPFLSIMDWKFENDWKDGHTTISSIDPFNIVENFKPQNSFLKDSIAISVEINEHEVLYVPAFWWVLELGVHSTTEENYNLVLREEFDPHHSMYEAVTSGLLDSAPPQNDMTTTTTTTSPDSSSGSLLWKSVEIAKRPVKLPDLL